MRHHSCISKYVSSSGGALHGSWNTETSLLVPVSSPNFPSSEDMWQNGSLPFVLSIAFAFTPYSYLVRIFFHRARNSRTNYVVRRSQWPGEDLYNHLKKVLFLALPFHSKPYCESKKDAAELLHDLCNFSWLCLKSFAVAANLKLTAESLCRGRKLLCMSVSVP